MNDAAATDPSRAGAGGRVDLDELARLEEDRDYLLRSIEDLDREHAAGDVDNDDYRELRDGYVARAAAAIRAIESNQTQLHALQDATVPRRGRTIAWAGASLVFALVAGVLLANALGSRGQGQGLTGSVPGDEATRCRTLTFQKPAEGITCYDAVLQRTPDDVDALTYQGWAKVRSGDVVGGTALFDRVVELDPTYPDVHVFRASVLKNAGDFAGAAAELDALYALNPAPVVISTLQQMGLDTAVAEGLLAPDVRACWQQEAAALLAVQDATSPASGEELDRSAVAGAFADLAISVQCFDDVLAARPDDADALLLRSLGMGLLAVIDESSVNRALGNVESALLLRPDDPTGLLLRAVWRDRTGDVDGALADLDAIGDRRPSALVATYVDRTQVRADLESQRAAAGAVTTTTAR